MRFVSTRTGESLSFQDAVLSGWAPDGGMLLPETLPPVSESLLKSWAKLTYSELCLEIFKLLIPDSEFPHTEFEDVFLSSFAGFGCLEVVKVKDAPLPLPGGGDPLVVHVAELWHGPTLAFKDLGMQVLARVLQKILVWRQEKQIMLVGTSGDTGSAAIEAVREIPEIGIVVLYPSREHSNVSRSQEVQICRRVGERSVRVVRVQGGSDDLDVPIDELFHDSQARSTYNLGSLNSVNIVRMLMQLVHLFYCYLQAEPTADRPAVLSIPTGAGGHIAAALLAVKMGLPVRRLLAATNENDLLPRFLATGCAKRGRVVGTTSPAMDVQVPYNIERILHIATGGDSDRVALWMDDFYSDGELCVDHATLAALVALKLESVSSDCGEVSDAVASVRAASGGYVVDPHTGVGLAALRQGVSAEEATQGPFLCMACAHPSKFPEFLGGLPGPTPSMPDTDHPCVSELLKLVAEAVDSEPIVTAVFEADNNQDWSKKLRDILDELQACM
eukprot:CAMPEP_0177758094 /NCGR_PEP_ID=MMETSP0491_2-20121128/4004_1 /TAXON_ID=63592 /ORGANISM="Tetraselmis chuii, Strain PLY429" /LENGTH=501 /DNA_ID=CAMNT_0019273811 /DNA_START=209 /DNA_END=1714 /DNA_ORIENTATION=-